MAENKRLTQLVLHLKSERLIYNTSDLADVLGISKPYMSMLLNGKKQITDKIVNKLVTKFPSINGDWLLTGEGTMLKDVQAQSFDESEGEEMLNEFKKATAELEEEIARLKKQIENRDETINVLTKALNKAQNESTL